VFSLLERKSRALKTANSADGHFTGFLGSEKILFYNILLL